MADFKKTTFEIDREKLEAFREIYPQQGATKWFFDSCLTAFIKLAKEGKIESLTEQLFENTVKDASTRMAEGGDSNV